MYTKKGGFFMYKENPNHIYLRKFKNQDKVTIGRCVAHKIPFGPAKLKNERINDMVPQVNNDYTLIIADKRSDNMLGVIQFYELENIASTDIWMFPWYEDNSPFATEAVEEFINYLKENEPEVKRVRMCATGDKPQFMAAAVRNGFRKTDDNEKEWEVRMS